MTIKERAWQRYAVAVLIALAGAAVRLAFMQVLGTHAAFLTFYPAVMLAALYGGFGPGLAATAVSGLLADYFWIEPVGHLGMKDTADCLSFAVFIASCVMISWIAETMRRSQERARQAELKAKTPNDPAKLDHALSLSSERFSIDRLKTIIPVNALLTGALALLVIIALSAYRSVTSMSEADRWQTHTYVVLESMEELLSSLKDAEDAQRGFLITGDESSLLLYTNAATQISREIKSLKNLTRDNPTQQKRLTDLDPLVLATLNELHHAIELRRSHGFDDAGKLVASGSGGTLMQDINARVGEMKLEEKRLLDARTQVKLTNTRGMIRTGVLGGLLSFALLLAAFRALRAEITQRIQAEGELKLHRNHLEELVQARTIQLESEVTVRHRSEAALQTNMQRLYSMLSSMYGGILLVTNDGKIEFANQSFCEYFNLKASPNALVGLAADDMTSLIRDSYAAPDQALVRIQSIVQAGQPVRGEEVAMANGRTYLRDYIPLDLEGKSYGRLWHHIDITERRIAEESVHNNQERLQLALKSAQMGTFEWDIVNNRRTWDERVHALLGTDPKTFSGSPEEFFAIMQAEDREHVQEALDKALESNLVYETEYRAIWKDGSIHHIAARGKLTTDATGTPVHLLGVCWDITERKQAEDEVRKLNRTLQALDKSNQALMRAQVESEYLNDVCRIVVEDCGHTMVWVGFAEQDPAKSVRVVAHAGFEHGYLETLTVTWADNNHGRGPTGTAIRSGKPCGCANMLTDPRFEPWRHEAIKRGYASSIALPLQAAGKAFGAITIYSKQPDPFSEAELRLLTELADDVANGITTIRARLAEIQARQLLEQSEERFRTMANALPQLAWIAQPDGFIYWYNQRWYDYTGTTPQQMEGWGWQSVHDQNVLPKVLAQWKQSIATGDPFEMVFPLRGADGRFRLFLTRGYPMKNHQGSVIQWFGTNTDVDELKRAEEALRKSENKFSILFNKASIPVVLSRFPDHAYIDVNDAWIQLFGYARQELIGKNSVELGLNRDLKARAETIATLEQRHPIRNLEQTLFTKSGDAITVLTNVDVIEIEGQRYALTSLQDITERKRAEAQVQLSLHEKEVMLKEIHHRVKNNLQVIASLVDMQTNALKDPTLKPLFQDVRDRVRSMAMVHEKLYQSVSLAQVEFADYTRSLLNYLWRTHDHSQSTILLNQDLQPVLLSVEIAVPCGLILNELVTNAFKHAFRGRTTGQIDAHLHRDEKGLVSLHIRDDGIGLPDGINWRESQSLGLRLINLLVVQLGATIEVRTSPGTEFTIQFQQTPPTD